MKSFIEKARKIHRNQKGFTLIELLVVLAILAIIVGLVVPNFFGITDDADAVQIQGQHEKMREAVYLYNYDTGQWPTEWSAEPLTNQTGHQLWFKDTITGWEGPYLDRPILQNNTWGGRWGVKETVSMNIGGVLSDYTVLEYLSVPTAVSDEVDRLMDDGTNTTGTVQVDGTTLTIVIAKE